MAITETNKQTLLAISMSITSVSTSNGNESLCSARSLKRACSIDNQGNIIRQDDQTKFKRRSPVFGVPGGVLTRSYSSIKPKETTIAVTDPEKASTRTFVACVSAGVLLAFLGLLFFMMHQHGELQVGLNNALANLKNGVSATLKSGAIQKASFVDNDKALQFAFETEFTCHKVVTADETQCNEKDDHGKTVRFYCPKSCNMSPVPKVSTQLTKMLAPSQTTDGEYKDYNSRFTQCAAVGSAPTCSGTVSRAQGCACEFSSQCSALGGTKCCYQGFCSYEHIAPLAPCM